MGFFDFFRAQPTQDAFANIVLRQIRLQGRTTSFRYEPAQFRICAEGDDELVFNLHNAYRDYCAVPRKQRGQVLQNYLTILDAPGVPSTFDDARVGLMPVLRSRTQGDHLRLLALHQQQAPVLACQALDDDAVIMLAYDTESSMLSITEAMLTQWGVTFDAALAVAIDNLRERTPQRFVSLGNGLLMGEWQDAYDSSRLLLPDLLYRACEGGEPLVMVPTRGRLLLASSNNVAGQLQMIALADQLVQQEGRHVSAAMYGVRERKIAVYQPADASVALALQHFQTMIRAYHYTEQKEEWEELNEKTGDDIFVASYILLRSEENGRVLSLTTWTRGADTLLPCTDIVAMVVPDQDGGESATKMLSWDDARAIGAGLMQEVADCYPVRYRVRDFPSEQCLASVDAQEVSHYSA